jgi:hypothetical protein
MFNFEKTCTTRTIYIYGETQFKQMCSQTCTYIKIYECMHAHHIYKHLQEIDLVGLEIDKVTTNISLSKKRHLPMNFFFLLLWDTKLSNLGFDS